MSRADQANQAIHGKVNSTEDEEMQGVDGEGNLSMDKTMEHKQQDEEENGGDGLEEDELLHNQAHIAGMMDETYRSLSVVVSVLFLSLQIGTKKS
jgi:hypothetical protein